MARILRLIALSLLTLFPVATAVGQSIFDIDYGGARSHPFDVLHIAVDLRFDEAAKEVIGSVTHRIRSLSNSLDSIRLDADSAIRITSVSVDGIKSGFGRQHNLLTIALPGHPAYDDTVTVSIDYRVVPTKGLYFIQPDSLAPNRRRQIWTQGEADDNHYWLPSYDYPNDLATSEVHATVRGDWKVVSNGRLVSVRRNKDGTATWHWSMEKPHSSYLIMLAAGDYLVTRDTVDGVPLEYWTYPDMPDRVATTFGRTPDVMRFLQDFLGVPYAWNKYAQVMIADFMYGGMENTTATTLNDFALVDERGLIDYNTDGLVAHEMAHQWYGDLVTNRSWGHLWLHESFATYLAARYRGYRYGEDAMVKEMYDAGGASIASDEWNGRNPIANGDGVTSNIYQRGSRVLYMLSRLVGDDLFRKSNKLFLERHAHGLVETNDLKIAFEDVTGLNLDWFFNEWIYKAGMPEFKVAYSYDGDSLRLFVDQIQERDSLTGLFRMPVPLEFHLRNRIVADTMWVGAAQDTFSIALPERPRFVIFDAGDAMLKKVEFPRSDEELIAQISAPRMIDRLLAVKALSRRDTVPGAAPVVAQALHDRYMNEPSSFVRAGIIPALSLIDSMLARRVVVLALRDPDVDVRRAAVEHSYLIPKSERVALLRPLLNDSSYSVVISTLGMVAATDTSGLEPYFLAMKGRKGRRDRLAESWLNGVGIGKFENLVNEVVDYTLPIYSKDTRAKAYMVLADLKSTTSPVRAAIERGLRESSGFVRSSAASAARAHLDDQLRDGLEHLRDQTSGERREVIEDILEGKE